MGLKVSTCGLRECLEATAGKLEWKAKRGKGRGVRRGVGMASLLHVGGSGRIYRSDATGVGESGLVPTAPAIANAIYDAIGVRIRDLPMTPDKILAALRRKDR